MPELNIFAAASLGIVALIYSYHLCCRHQMKTAGILLSVWALWLIGAAVARWIHVDYGPIWFVTFVQDYAWVARLCAAAAITMRLASDKDGNPPPEFARELAVKVEKLKNGEY